MGEKSFVGPRPEKSHAKASVCEGVENTVRHGGGKEKEQSAPETAVKLSKQTCAKQRDKRGEQNRMAEAAMPELCRIRDAQTERHDIQVRKHRSDDPGEQQPTRDDLAAKGKSEGKRNGRMRDDGWHYQYLLKSLRGSGQIGGYSTL